MTLGNNFNNNSNINDNNNGNNPGEIQGRDSPELDDYVERLLKEALNIRNNAVEPLQPKYLDDTGGGGGGGRGLGRSPSGVGGGDGGDFVGENGEDKKLGKFTVDKADLSEYDKVLGIIRPLSQSLGDRSYDHKKRRVAKLFTSKATYHLVPWAEHQ